MFCCAVLRWAAGCVAFAAGQGQEPMVALIFRRGEVVPRCSHRPVDDGRRKRSICRAALTCFVPRGLCRFGTGAAPKTCHARRESSARSPVLLGRHGLQGLSRHPCKGACTRYRLLHQPPASRTLQKLIGNAMPVWKRCSHSLLCFEAASLLLVRRHRGGPEAVSVGLGPQQKYVVGCTLNEQGAALPNQERRK